MKPREYQRRGFKISLTMHGIVLVLVLVWPFVFRACNRHRPNEQLTFVEFTVSVPPPAAPDVSKPPTPEPLKPEPLPEDIKVPDPQVVKKPTPPKDIRQTNRVARKDFKGPPPKDKPPSEAEIARLLKIGAHIGETTSIPDDDNLDTAVWQNKIHDRMYAAWQLPPQLENLPGLSTVVTITVNPDGIIAARRKTRGSGNDLMDDSVMKAVNSVRSLPPLPIGHRRPVDIDITFVPE